MSGAVPPLPVYAFTVWTAPILLFYIPIRYEACFIIRPADAQLSAEM